MISGNRGVKGVFMRIGHLIFSALVFLALSSGGVTTASAQSAPSTITVGSSPVSVAVNPTTGRVYVANNSSSSLSVVDGATDRVIAT
ncbi:MAG TPA: hypothetical protein VFZ25_14820, partial [Chloroflexota bacterium]|nr:hypothetical protein [Chloroflexota bacterium]